MKRGHIKLSRKMFDGDDLFWSEPRTFSRAEAWIDLIQLAQWRRRAFASKYGVIELRRGEFVGSMRFLGKRWGWSAKRVLGFLETLAKSQRLEKQRETPAGSVYLLVNYDTYQSERVGDEAVEETPTETPRKQTGNSEETARKQEQAVKAGKAVKEQKTPAPSALPSARGGSAPRAPGFDLAPFLVAYREHFGPNADPPAARFGRVFKRLTGKHGADETLRRWRICLAAKGDYATPEELAAKWDRYAVEMVPGTSEPAVELQYDDPAAPGYVGLMPNGDMSPLMQQLTDPAPRFGRAS